MENLKRKLVPFSQTRLIIEMIYYTVVKHTSLTQTLTT